MTAAKTATTIEQSVYIAANEQVANGIGLMTIDAPYIAANLLPGQFVHLAIPGFGGHILRRPFSVFSTSPDTGQIEIVYQAVGEGPRFMLDLDAPVSTQLHGPVGKPWNAHKSAKRCLLVGGGLGCAPLLLLAQQLSQRAEVFVVLGAQSAEQMIYQDYFFLFIDSKHLIVTTDDGSLGLHGFTTVPARELLAQDDFDYVATCGPEPMQRLIAELAAEYEVPCEVSLERRMACGIGACLSCVVETRQGRLRACVDGPVFNAAEVVW
jgi:dihydroorotate dehydrogenase electron transfer subunit